MEPTPLTDLPFAVEPPSQIERLSRFIPIIGWTVAAELEKERRRPKANYISRQLAARREWTTAAWGNDPKRTAVALAVSQVIEQEFDWPNSNYVPQDRLDLLMWEAEDGMAVISCFFAIEQKVGVTLPVHRNESWDITLGQLVDLILSLPRRCLKCGYDLRATPSRCPECGSQATF